MNYDTGALDPATVPADLTITFHAPKRGHYCYPAAGARGELVVAPIGVEDSGPGCEVPSSVVLADRALVQTLLPRRSPDGNKGTHGKALIVAGCADYMGAPTLAARAAYRVGAGLVAYAVPQAVRMSATLACPEATFVSLPEAVDVHVPAGVPRIAAWLKSIGAGAVLAFGPGLGQAPETAAFTEALLRELVAHIEGRGLLCDADALNILAGWPDWPARLPGQTILTPHPGEMARLMRSSVSDVQADRIGNALRCAADWNCVVLLKGAYTVIAAPDGRAAVLPFANPAMAVAGMGDVLSGCIAGLLAQGLPPFDAAVAGGYVHAMAGGTWLERHGDAGLLASDLFDLLPDALRSIKQAATASA